MSDAQLSFKYVPEQNRSELDAYDAGVALYGIARSLAIVTHYTLHGEIIRQDPALRDAKVLVRPPKAGSFEFLFDVAANWGSQLPPGIAVNAFYDLLKLTYKRATGQKDAPETKPIKSILSSKPGDIDALNDATNTDILRIHRPFEGGVVSLHISGNINVYGGQVAIGDFNQQTYEYVKADKISSVTEAFIGRVASYNSNADTGRIFLSEEGRTVSFKRDRKTKLKIGDRRLLSWSLDQYVNHKNGDICLIGFPLRDREGKLKNIFLTSVSTIGRVASG